jgi:pimeloyl-ACP methyl ester carboxylesterase
MSAAQRHPPGTGQLDVIRVGPHRFAYRRAGAGEPVLLLHGVITHSFLWEGVMAGLVEAGGYDLVAPDLLGCGASDKPLDVPYGLAARAERMVRFLDELGLRQVHVVGHDIGGGIAQIMAVRWPGRLKSLALVNTVGYDSWPVQPIASLRTPVVRELLVAALDLGVLSMVVKRAFFHKERITRELMAEFARPLADPGGRKAFVHFARSLDNRELLRIAPDLRRIALPTLVAWGMADVYLSYSIAERLAADIPGARLERLPTAGHFAPLDEPERLTALLRAHLDAAPR